MYSKANKVLSLAMSAAILLTNMMTPMKVYADEISEPAQDLESEMPPDTEPVSYYLTLPYYDAVSYSVEKNHVETNDYPGSKDIRLAYHEDDKVEFSFHTADTVQVMEIHLKDPKKQEYTFSVDENKNITLFMPAKDLELTLVMEENPVPDPVSETEQPAEPVSAAEAEDTWEQPDNQDDGINEFDLTAQLPIGKYTLTEVTAPKGYDIAETVSFEVIDSAEIVHVKMMDKPKDELVDLTGKKKETTPGGYTVGTPVTPGTPSVTAAPVKTGDYNRYLPAILLVVCGGAGLAGAAFGRRKKKLMEK